MLTSQQKRVAYFFSYCLAGIDALKKEERPKTRLWNKLDNLEDHLNRVLDEYRIEKFNEEDLKKADELFELMDTKIREVF